MASQLSTYLFFSKATQYPSKEFLNIIDKTSFLSQKAQTILNSFSQWVRSTSIKKIQECYTQTFDLQSICYPYVGYQLFGESYKRGFFMATLKGHYFKRNFTLEQELPDHLSVLLRYLDHLQVIGDKTEKETIIEEGLLPALKKIKDSFKNKDKENPYYKLLEALDLTLNSDIKKKHPKQFFV